MKSKNPGAPHSATRVSTGGYNDEAPVTGHPLSRRALVARHRRTIPRVLGGVDVDKAVAAMRKLPVFRDHPLPRKIRVDVGLRETRGVRGTAWPHEDRIRVAGFPETAPAYVLEVVLHELVHLACPTGEHHGERFRRVFARAVREMWSIEVPIDPPDPGRYGNKSYAQGRLVVEALKGRPHDFAPDPPTPEKPRHEIIDGRVQARAEHARKMLKKAATRRKRAETIEKKWKAKVAYYAKKGI